MKIAILSFPSVILLFASAFQAQVATTHQGGHKATRTAPQQPTLQENYQYIEEHLNNPGTLTMTVDYGYSDGTHSNLSVDYGIDSAAVSACVMQYAAQTNVKHADSVATNETLAIENDAEYKAYSQAVALSDDDAKIQALLNFEKTYPKSVATKNVLDELMRSYFTNNDKSAIEVAAKLLKMNTLNPAALYITDHTPACAAEEPGYLVHLINCVTRINLSDAKDITLQPFGEYLKQRHTALGIAAIRVKVTQPDMTALTIELKDGQKAVLPISEATVADKMQQAMTHAVEVCGKRKK